MNSLNVIIRHNMAGRAEILILVLCYAATQTRSQGSQVTAKRQHIRLPVVTPFFPVDAPQYNPVAASNQQHTLRPYVPGNHDFKVPLEDEPTPTQQPFQRNTTKITEVKPEDLVPSPYRPFHHEDTPTSMPVLKTNLPSDGKLPQPLKVQGLVNNTDSVENQYVRQDVNRPVGDADSIIFPNITDEDDSLEEPQVTQRVSNDTKGIADDKVKPDIVTSAANDKWGTEETPAPVYQAPVVPAQPTPTLNTQTIPFIITNLNPSVDTLKNVAPIAPLQVIPNTVPTNTLQYHGLCVPSSSSSNIANINGNLYAVLTVPSGNSNLVPCATYSDYQGNVQLLGQYPNNGNQLPQGTYYAISNPGLVNAQVNPIPTYGVRSGVDSSSSVPGSLPVYVQSQSTATAAPQYIVLNG